MATIFWDLKGHITIDFFEKGATVISASYCQLLRRQYLPYLLNHPGIIYKNIGFKGWLVCWLFYDILNPCGLFKANYHYIYDL